jgi:hypothetical protein
MLDSLGEVVCVDTGAFPDLKVADRYEFPFCKTAADPALRFLSNTASSEQAYLREN